MGYFTYSFEEEDRAKFVQKLNHETYLHEVSTKFKCETAGNNYVGVPNEIGRHSDPPNLVMNVVRESLVPNNELESDWNGSRRVDTFLLNILFLPWSKETLEQSGKSS